jgi:hypothetical protein
MTQEDKKLLLKDLCTRLPFNVKIHNPHPRFPNPDEYIQTLTDIHGTMQSNWITFGTDCEEINVNWNIGNKEEDVPKPYLRQMSSMTEKEKEGLRQEHLKDEKLYAECITRLEHGDNSMRGKVIPHFAADWCNEHYFDYRGLIEMNLALEAPEGMYNS